MNQCSLKHFPLPGGREAGDENHKPGMKSLAAVKCGEIRSIVSDKNILARVNSRYQLPIFVAAEPEKIHVITVVTVLMCDGYERSVQTLVNEELHELPS